MTLLHVETKPVRGTGQRSQFEAYGLNHIVHDLLRFPGTLIFDDRGELVYVQLLSQMKNSTDLLFCLERYCLERFS